MKLSLKDPIFLLLLFLIVRLVVLMWDSPFYHTPTDKTLNVLKGVGVGVAILGGAYLWSYKRGVELRGEGPFDTDREYDWLIAVYYIVWVIVWEFFDLIDANAQPFLHYFGMLMGILFITFLWFELGSIKEAWWKLLE